MSKNIVKKFKFVKNKESYGKIETFKIQIIVNLGVSLLAYGINVWFLSNGDGGMTVFLSFAVLILAIFTIMNIINLIIELPEYIITSTEIIEIIEEDKVDRSMKQPLPKQKYSPDKLEFDSFVTRGL